MYPRTFLFALLVGAALFPSAAAPQEEKRPSLERLAWLTGSWQFTRDGRTVEEHWIAPAGGSMLAVNRTVAGDRTVAFEFLQIRSAPAGLAYIAQPNGRPPTVFPLKRMSDDEVVFENPAHDFPQRIVYRRTAHGFNARIEGTINGQERAMDFPFQRKP